MRKLGKAPKVEDPRTLKMASFVSASTLPTPPAVLDLTLGVADWPMYANNELGDCTCAGAAHMIERWTLEATGTPEAIPVEAVVAAYRVFSPAPADNGAAELDVLRYWRKTGIAGHNLEGFVEVPVGDPEMLRVATYLFGGLYIGVQLPLAWQRETGAGKVWDVGSGGDFDSGSWGGHCVSVCGYSPDVVEVVTWGAVQAMTWAAWRQYVDEAYACLPAEYEAFALKPDAAGFDLEHLREALMHL